MSDELDPQLLSHFAAASSPLDGAEFVAQTEGRLRKTRRVRRLLRWLVALLVLALAAWAAPYAIAASVTLSAYLGEVLLSPWGWGASVLVGGWIVWRARARVRMR